jgi:nucleoside-diphosphate kinase
VCVSRGWLRTPLPLLCPAGVQRGLVGQIVARFEAKGFTVVGLKMVQPPRAKVEEHYQEHHDRPFFSALCDFFCSGPVVMMCLQGRLVVQQTRAQIGKTKPEESAAGTIRGDLAVDVRANVIHGSDSPASAARELALWFEPGELVAWNQCTQPWLYKSGL